METIEKKLTSREKLIHYFEEIEEERVNNLYEFLKPEIEEEWGKLTYTDEFTAELDKIEDEYQKTGVAYSKAEIEAHTEELLKQLNINALPPTIE